MIRVISNKIKVTDGHHVELVGVVAIQKDNSDPVFHYINVTYEKGAIVRIPFYNGAVRTESFDKLVKSWENLNEQEK